MADFKNEFSWSASRDRLFRSCPRAYYYNYYSYWNGWSYNADEETKLTYKLKKLQALPLLAGSIVHDIIQLFLEINRDLQKCKNEREFINISGRLIPFKNQKNLSQLEKDEIESAINQINSGKLLERRTELFLSIARAMLIKGFIESAGQKTKFNSKTVHLFEHYYEGTLSQEKANSTKEKVYCALENFCQSEHVKEMIERPVENWKSVDELTKYNLKKGSDQNLDIPIWCAIDFSYVDANEELWIIDWKTGKENKAELKNQLASYAIYANQEWGFDFDKIHLCGIYLNELGRMSEYPLTTAEIADARKNIVASSEKMLEFVDTDNNISVSLDKLHPSITYKCQFCNFKELCQKSGVLGEDIQASIEENAHSIDISSQDLTIKEDELTKNTVVEIAPTKVKKKITRYQKKCAENRVLKSDLKQTQKEKSKLKQKDKKLKAAVDKFKASNLDIKTEYRLQKNENSKLNRKIKLREKRVEKFIVENKDLNDQVKLLNKMLKDAHKGKYFQMDLFK